VLERRDDGMRYAHIAPDRIAGTIGVTCARSASPDETEVTVTYDVTSLGPAGVAFVEELEAGYDAFLASWREEILDGLAGGHDAHGPAGASVPTAGTAHNLKAPLGGQSGGLSRAGPYVPRRDETLDARAHGRARSTK
jgi:hypothetical protein